MTCQEFENLYHDFIDGVLSPGQQQRLRNHRQTCPACAQKFETSVAIIKALQDEDVPPPSEHFAFRVIAEAIHSGKQSSTQGKRILPAAMVASLIAVVLLTTLLVSKPEMQDPVVVLRGGEVQVVRISIESAKDFARATIAINLSNNLEINERSNSTSLVWETALKKGTNVINLPILPTAHGDGLITTRIMLGDKEKSVRIKTRNKMLDEVRLSPEHYLS